MIRWDAAETHVSRAVSTLLLVLALSGCAKVWSAKPPGYRYGVAHAVVTAGATVLTEELGLPGGAWLGATSTCVGWVMKEFEESQGYTRYGPEGPWDAWFDQITPCTVGFTLSWRLRR